MSKYPRLPQRTLHTLFIDALSEYLMDSSDIDTKPLEIDLRPPMPIRIRLYIFNATHPPGGRTLGEHKIQLIAPGQKPGTRGSFDDSDGRIVILAGYQSELEVFILWDSGLYPEFSYSRNVQVNPESIYGAYAGKLVEQKRRLRGQGTEVVITSNSENLPKAMIRRLELTQERLLEED